MTHAGIFVLAAVMFTTGRWSAMNNPPIEAGIPWMMAFMALVVVLLLMDKEKS